MKPSGEIQGSLKSEKALQFKREESQKIVNHLRENRSLLQQVIETTERQRNPWTWSLQDFLSPSFYFKPNILLV